MTIFLGLLFGALGGVYLAWGRRTHNASHLVVGAALMIYPIFVTRPIFVLIIGVALAMIPLAQSKGWI
jgi:hypothetical protein